MLFTALARVGFPPENGSLVRLFHENVILEDLDDDGNTIIIKYNNGVKQVTRSPRSSSCAFTFRWCTIKGCDAPSRQWPHKSRPPCCQRDGSDKWLSPNCLGHCHFLRDATARCPTVLMCVPVWSNSVQALTLASSTECGVCAPPFSQGAQQSRPSMCRRQNRAGPASLAARFDDMRKNGNAEKRPTLFQCRCSTLGTRDGGDAHARIWRAVARAARRVARNSGGRPSGRDRQINRSYQSQHAPAADALHCVRLQSRRAHGNTSALARTAGRSCSNYAQ